MRRHKVTPMPRPAMMSGLSARTPKEAAVHLVRLEFDRSRIAFGLQQTARRAARLEAEAEAIEDRRRALLTILSR